jgi:hypothetical protein
MKFFTLSDYAVNPRQVKSVGRFTAENGDKCIRIDFIDKQHEILYFDNEEERDEDWNDLHNQMGQDGD